MGYPYHDLDDAQFERLVVEVMRKLFGVAVTGFAPGPDGGRDARFNGTANEFPSRTAPWVGITVGQAKLTSAFNAHFNDAGFSSDAESSVLSEEIARVAALVKNKRIDHYILFTNRRLGGNVNDEIIERISTETGLATSSIHLVGIEQLDVYLHSYPDVIELARIDPVDGPLVVSSYQLAEVILAIRNELQAPAVADSFPVPRVPFDEKNEANGMSPEYAKAMERNYLKYSAQIGRFLADPANLDVLADYEAAVEEFQLKIIAKRQDYQSFDAVMNRLFDLLFERDGVLSKHRRAARALVFYMYWHCDIGKTPDAASQ